LKEVLAERGLSSQEIDDKLSFFLTNQIAKRELAEEAYD
jgi:hypothetical protein